MAQAAKNKRKRPAAKTNPRPAPAKTRRLKQPAHRSLRISKRLKPVLAPLPSAYAILRTSLTRLRARPRLFTSIIIIYAVLTIALVHGLASGVNLETLKTGAQQLFNGHGGSRFSTSLSLFGLLLGTIGGDGSTTAGLYQTILLIIFSLVLIWSLRQLQAGQAISLRDAFYKSLYPLVPFLLVLLVIGLQLVPLLIGSSIYNMIVNNGIAVGGLERLLSGFIFLVLSLLSFYWLSSSLFALYIVTLPDMTPFKALRSARQLVRFRRWAVFRKLIFLPMALLVVGAALMIPVIMVYAASAQWVFFAYTMAAVAAIHSYMYSLYRELL
jgi:hypothetical protein